MPTRPSSSRRGRAALTALALAGSALLAAPSAHGVVTEPVGPTATPTPLPRLPSCSATVEVTEVWPGGYLAELVVDGMQHGTVVWRVSLDATVANAWNAQLTDDGDLVNAPWNGRIMPWRATTAGFVGVGEPGSLAARCTPGWS